MPGGLVGQHPPGRPEPLIREGAGEAPVAGHPGHVQVLGDDRFVAGGEHRWWPCAARRRGGSRRGRAGGPAGRPPCGGPPTPVSFRACARAARRSRRSPARSGFGPGTVITVPVSSAPVSSDLTPRSIPIAVPGRGCGSGTARSTSTVKDTNQRCAVRDTVADRIRAVPSSSRRASFRVDSWVPDHPEAGQGDRAPPAAQRPGQPERVPAPAPLLEPGEAQPAPLPLALLRPGELPQRPVQVTERLLVGALGVLLPTRPGPGRPSSPAFHRLCSSAPEYHLRSAA